MDTTLEYNKLVSLTHGGFQDPKQTSTEVAQQQEQQQQSIEQVIVILIILIIET